MLGYLEEDIRESPDEWFDRVHKDDIDRVLRDISTHIHKKTSHFMSEHRIRHQDDSFRWILSRGVAVWNLNHKAIRIAGSISDITDRKEAEERLLHDAFHDALTGLPNRALFFDRLSQTIERSKRSKDFVYAVLFLDLDNFKDVNDSIGHLIGDKLLVMVARRLEKGLRSIDTIARFGGDEFIVLLDDIKDVNGITRVTDWIKTQFETPFQLAGQEIHTSASIGAVLCNSDYQDAEEIIRNADIAMYAAKDRGKGREAIFDPSMRQRFLDRLNTETDLRKAIPNHELQAYYQPIVVLETGQLTGFEALVRWQHPDKGLLLPEDFIKIAEETGQIFDIDLWILENACRQVSIWNREYKFNPELTISVNISGKHITNPTLYESIKKVLQETKIVPHNLKLEITELSIVDQNEVTALTLAKLKNLGVQIQIDDFGIGYSSLNYLSRFPINALKIDRSFINQVLEDASQREIIKAIVDLTETLKVSVIAEGVENTDQVGELLKLGCEYAQGYHFSLPLDTQKIEEMLVKIVEGDGNLPG
jgi:diguanylate cyclase (GGDEF)-like protein/PAS domain S-box-containing protein